MPTETKTKPVMYRSIDLTLERCEVKDASRCAECGMTTKHAREYHPFAACLMFRATRNGHAVRGNLEAVIQHALERTPDGR